MNGTKNIGFNTIGKPNITDSLMLNKPGAKDNLAISFWSACLLNMKIAISVLCIVAFLPKITIFSRTLSGASRASGYPARRVLRLKRWAEAQTHFNTERNFNGRKPKKKQNPNG